MRLADQACCKERKNRLASTHEKHSAIFQIPACSRGPTLDSGDGVACVVDCVPSFSYVDLRALQTTTSTKYSIYL